MPRGNLQLRARRVGAALAHPFLSVYDGHQEGGHAWAPSSRRTTRRRPPLCLRAAGVAPGVALVSPPHELRRTGGVDLVAGGSCGHRDDIGAGGGERFRAQVQMPLTGCRIVHEGVAVARLANRLEEIGHVDGRPTGSRRECDVHHRGGTARDVGIADGGRTLPQAQFQGNRAVRLLGQQDADVRRGREAVAGEDGVLDIAGAAAKPASQTQAPLPSQEPWPLHVVAALQNVQLGKL